MSVNVKDKLTGAGRAFDQADRIEALLENIAQWCSYGMGTLAERTQAEALERMRVRKTDVAVVAGNVAEITFQAPQGMAWQLHAITASGKAAGTVYVYLHSTTDPINLMWVLAATPASGRQSDQLPDGLYVPGGARVIVRFEGQDVDGSRVTAALMVDQLPDTVPVNVEKNLGARNVVELHPGAVADGIEETAING